MVTILVVVTVRFVPARPLTLREMLAQRHGAHFQGERMPQWHVYELLRTYTHPLEFAEAIRRVGYNKVHSSKPPSEFVGDPIRKH